MFLGLRERVLFFENFYSNIIGMALCHCFFPHTHTQIRRKPFLPFAHLLTLIYCFYTVRVRARNSLMHFDVSLNKEFSCALVAYDACVCVPCGAGSQFRQKQHVSICVDQQRAHACVNCVCKSSEHNVQCVYFSHVKDENESSSSITKQNSGMK